MISLRRELETLFRPDFLYKFLASNSHIPRGLKNVPITLSYQLSPPWTDRRFLGMKALMMLEGLFPQRPRMRRVFVRLRFRQAYVVFILTLHPNFLSFLSLYRFFPRKPMPFYRCRDPFPLRHFFLEAGLPAQIRGFRWSHRLVCTLRPSLLLLLLKGSFLD